LKEGIARTTLRKKAKVKMSENKMQRKTRSHVVNMASKDLRNELIGSRSVGRRRYTRRRRWRRLG
jgi:hypothetical protein